MTDNRPKKLEGLPAWMCTTTGNTYSGKVAYANTAVLKSYSHEEHRLYTANVDLERGMVEWTYT